MITLLMRNPDRNRREIPLLTRILLIILAVCAAFCFGVAGMYGFLLFNRNPADYQKQERESMAEGSAKMDESGLAGKAVLKSTADAGRDYIDETLFLGDSNTVRFMTFYDEEGYSYTSDQNTIAVVGIGAEGITTIACEQLSYGTYTMVDAVAFLQPKRIILTFGTNNLDSELMDADTFIENYELQVQALEEAYPYADLIINSIPPVAEVSHYAKISISQIREFNQAILAMCEHNDWKFLNSFEALSDKRTGFAKPGYMEADGIHLTETGMAALFRYIRTHAWIGADRRPMPLDPIPEIYGPITEIFNIDPLSNLPFDESVLHPHSETHTSEISPETVAEPPVITEEPVAETPESAGEEPVVNEEPVSGDPISEEPPAEENTEP